MITESQRDKRQRFDDQKNVNYRAGRSISCNQPPKDKALNNVTLSPCLQNQMITSAWNATTPKQPKTITKQLNDRSFTINNQPMSMSPLLHKGSHRVQSALGQNSKPKNSSFCRQLPAQFTEPADIKQEQIPIIKFANNQNAFLLSDTLLHRAPLKERQNGQVKIQSSFGRKPNLLTGFKITNLVGSGNNSEPTVAAFKVAKGIEVKLDHTEAKTSTSENDQNTLFQNITRSSNAQKRVLDVEKLKEASSCSPQIHPSRPNYNRNIKSANKKIIFKVKNELKKQDINGSTFLKEHVNGSTFLKEDVNESNFLKEYCRSASSMEQSEPLFIKEYPSNSEVVQDQIINNIKDNIQGEQNGINELKYLLKGQDQQSEITSDSIRNDVLNFLKGKSSLEQVLKERLKSSKTIQQTSPYLNDEPLDLKSSKLDPNNKEIVPQNPLTPQNNLSLFPSDLTQCMSMYTAQSPFCDEQHANITSSQLPFSDPDFVPSESTLGRRIKKKQEWRRVATFLNQSDIQVLGDEFSSSEIHQGVLGDCQLIGPLSLLADHRIQIERLLHIKQANSFGQYAVWLFIDGEWRQTPVDDYFPYNSKKKTPVFARNIKNQIWPMLIEKAWAKFNRSYSRIIGGCTDQAFRLLTGAPTEKQSVQKKQRQDPRRKEELWTAIKKNLSRNQVIGLCTGALDEGGKLMLTQGHSQALIGVDEEQRKLIIRDPRGTNHKLATDIYNMDFNQAVRLFTLMIVCKVRPDQLQSSYKLEQAECGAEDGKVEDGKVEDIKAEVSEFIVKVEVEQSMHAQLSFQQAQKKLQRQVADQERYQYAKITVRLYRKDNRDRDFKQVVMGKRQKKQLDLEVQLKKGVQYMYVKCHWRCSRNRRINVVGYGQAFLKFCLVKDDEIINKIKDCKQIKKLE